MLGGSAKELKDEEEHHATECKATHGSGIPAILAGQEQTAKALPASDSGRTQKNTRVQHKGFGGKEMFKYVVVFAVAGLLATGVSEKSNPSSQSWQIDTDRSDAQLVTDATTDFGKEKVNATLGAARVKGDMTVDDRDPANSRVDLAIYPATSVVAPTESGANFLSEWLSNIANHTLIYFHSKNLVRTGDGRLQSTGTLVLTRVDRNIIEANANEAYSGPVYGPPIVHSVSQQATFIFDVPAGGGNRHKDGNIQASGTTSMYRDNFPQLVMRAIRTYWPPVVQDEKCTNSEPIESYSGAQWTGTYLKAPALPQAPHSGNLEDFPGAPNFNAIVGNQLTIQLHLCLSPKRSAQQTAAGE